MKELRIDVPGYNGIYQVSNLGRVRSVRLGNRRMLKLLTNKRGYLYIRLCKESQYKAFYVHRMVLNSFMGGGEGLQTNHKNGVKQDNRIDNLERCTQSENLIHRHQVLGVPPLMKGKFGALHNRSKGVIREDTFTGNKTTYGSMLEAKRETGTSLRVIQRSIAGKSTRSPYKRFLFIK